MTGNVHSNVYIVHKYRRKEILNKHHFVTPHSSLGHELLMRRFDSVKIPSTTSFPVDDILFSRFLCCGALLHCQKSLNKINKEV